jgi:hypothetical protein
MRRTSCSLYQAFYGVGEHRYFLDVRKLMGGAEFEECIFFRRTTQRDARRYEDEEAQTADFILPLSVLRGGAGDFGRWSRRIARMAMNDADRVRPEDQLADIEERWIRVIDDYKFPVVTLSESVDAEAVCTIFETLNGTGVKLTAFECYRLLDPPAPPTRLLQRRADHLRPDDRAQHRRPSHLPERLPRPCGRSGADAGVDQQLSVGPVEDGDVPTQAFEHAGVPANRPDEDLGGTAGLAGASDWTVVWVRRESRARRKVGGRTGKTRRSDESATRQRV